MSDLPKGQMQFVMHLLKDKLEVWTSNLLGIMQLNFSVNSTVMWRSMT